MSRVSVLDDSNPFGAFMPGSRFRYRSESTGPLSDLDFAVKDNIDVAGTNTGAGNPYWATTHGIADDNAPVIDQLLAAGASIIGKTITEELAYSLIGDNAHFGAPINPKYPDRFAGGSSSGSAACVASGESDFALGTDTSGSVRIPASNCGLFGIRPSHNSLDMTGVVPLSPSFDVIGWMTRDATVLRRVGEILLPRTSPTHLFPGFFMMQSAFDLLPEHYRQLFATALEASSLPCLGWVDDSIGWPNDGSFVTTHKNLQAHEAWTQHSAWLNSAPPGEVSSEVEQRFRAGEGVSQTEIDAAMTVRRKLALDFSQLLERFSVFAMPTAITEPLLRHASSRQRADYRNQTLQMTNLSSLTGLPEVTVPFVNDTGVGIGLSFISSKGTDRRLLASVEAWH